MISNSPGSYTDVFHIHFHFQENISAETVILRTFQAFRGAPKNWSEEGFYTTLFCGDSGSHIEQLQTMISLQYIVCDLL